MWVLEHFVKCWRGQETLGTTFLATVLVYFGVFAPLYFLRTSQKKTGLEGRLAIAWLSLVGMIFVVIWFTVSMWRASRSSFLSGARFWPSSEALLPRRFHDVRFGVRH